MELRLLLGLGAEPLTLGPWLALALTYLAHSLVWAGAAAVLVCFKARASTQRSYWRVALFGPLFSAALACLVTHGFDRSQTAVPAYARELAVPSFESAGYAPAHEPSPSASMASSALRATNALPLSRMLCGLACGAAALGLLRFLGGALLLRRRLAGRQASADPRLLRRFALVSARMNLHSIALTESDAVGSPLVIGLAEVCLPRAALEGLSDSELDCVLAHELAHLEHRDGLWFPLAGVVQSVLWLQPLNQWVSSRFRNSAELACDDRAVEVTGDPLGLARALVHVAAAAAFSPLPLVPTMAHSKSALVPRVRRLTRPFSGAGPKPARREKAGAVAVVAALGALLGTLNIRVAQARPRVAAVPSAVDARIDEQTQQMADLARREQRVSAQLAAAERLPGADRDGTPEAVRVLELSQELRHVHATQAWLEERLSAAR